MKTIQTETLDNIFKDLDFNFFKKLKQKSQVEFLYPFITKAENEGYKVKDIYSYLITKGLKIKEYTFYTYRTRLKQNKNEQKGYKMDKNKTKKIGLVNFKGGVGKSTIANLLDYEGSIVINIDMQNAKEINAGERTIDYFEQKEELEVNTPSELINLLEKEGVELIFIDTPGAITEEFLDVLPLLDYVILVANTNTRDVSHTINTMFELADLNAKIIILYNKWTTENELNEAKEMLNNLAKEEFGNNFIGSTDLKFSRAIPTIDRTKKNIVELSAVNKVAYIIAKRNILKMKNDILDLINKG